MKPLLEWSDNYLVGIEELDIEHKDLIDRLNQLHRQLARRHSDKYKIEGYLKEIYTRILAHFKLEERLMCDTDYPGYEEHKKEHDAFLAVVDDIIKKYQTSPNYSFQDVLESILQHWISNHITTSDRELGIHMKGVGDNR